MAHIFLSQQSNKSEICTYQETITEMAKTYSTHSGTGPKYPKSMEATWQWSGYQYVTCTPEKGAALGLEIAKLKRFFSRKTTPARLPRYAGTGHAGRHNTSQGDALVHLEACGKARQDFVMNRDIGKTLTVRDK